MWVNCSHSFSFSLDCISNFNATLSNGRIDYLILNSLMNFTVAMLIKRDSLLFHVFDSCVEASYLSKMSLFELKALGIEFLRHLFVFKCKSFDVILSLKIGCSYLLTDIIGLLHMSILRFDMLQSFLEFNITVMNFRAIVALA